MNKSAIKRAAVTMRNRLLAQIEQRAHAIGVTASEVQAPGQCPEADDIGISAFAIQRDRLMDDIRHKGFHQVMDEAAGTWFNRLVALRFMEVNGYLDTGVKALSSVSPGTTEPELLTRAHSVDLPVDRRRIRALQRAGRREELYRYLLMAQCRSLSEPLPFLFAAGGDYAELLLPAELLSDGSVIRILVDDLVEEDWLQGVEIIGWLYQSYISGKKDEVFADLKKNRKIAKDSIPAATQLFTPSWIVKYLVENSVGRLWLDSHPNEELRRRWKYCVEPLEQTANVQALLLQAKAAVRTPEELTVLDPACGTGHILVYAFDVLYDIYSSEGYPEASIPKLILEKNVYGLDIDDRVVQLACFLLMMKARERNPHIFRERPQLHIAAFQEPERLSPETKELLLRHVPAGNRAYAERQLRELVAVFRQAKLLGSLLAPDRLDMKFWTAQLAELRRISDESPQPALAERLRANLEGLVRQAAMLRNAYHAVVSNPPYMGRKGMNDTLAAYVTERYPLSQSDLFAVFLERTLQLVTEGGFNATINQHSWMFLSSYEELRKYVMTHAAIQSMLHLGSRAFEEIGGEVVQSAAFVLRKLSLPHCTAKYYRLLEAPAATGKEEQFLKTKETGFYTAEQESFASIPGSPMIYWVSARIRRLFEQFPPIGELCACKKGMDTGNNEAFLRLWHEIDIRKLGVKWFPYNKGGEFRRWYGNNYYVVNWEDNGRDIRAYPKSNLRNERMYLQPGLTWSTVSTSTVSFRRFGAGHLFDNGGSCVFTREEHLDSMLAFLNSKIPQIILQQINPTVNYQPGDIAKIPLHPDVPGNPELSRCGRENMAMAKDYWDSFEGSWEFAKHPLLRYRKLGSLQKAWDCWAEYLKRRMERLRTNEESANRLLIAMYGLQGEVSPQVADHELTVQTSTPERAVRSFISYAVGCMLGRYSLDCEGILPVGSEERADDRACCAFPPVKDAMLLFPSDAHSQDRSDVAALFVQFVEVSFGERDLHDNLQFIAAMLGRTKHETAVERIRKYLLNDFYEDHVKLYRKRPIYWMFTSGSGRVFQALIYIHRYTKDTLTRMRTDGVRQLHARLEAEERHCELLLWSEKACGQEQAGTRRASRRLAELKEQCAELRSYEELLHSYEEKLPELDMDSGVKANYAKLAELLAPIR